MKANEANLLKFLQGPKQFRIPNFQRRYSWERHHCEQLWRDVLRVGQDKSTHSHFLGSIVCMEHGIYSASTVPELLVIDGQQRLTTLSLLLLALGRAIEAQNSEIDITRRKLENYYLFNADEDDEYRYKQRLTLHDNDTLMQLLDNKEFPADISHRLEENYRFFEAKLKDTDLKVVYEGIQKLTIVDISLNRDHDNPQLIFDSLNSTGLDLSQADRIRNYVLMGQDSDFQDRLYEMYWYPMEQRFGTEYTKRFDRFIRDYLTLKTGELPNKGRVYESFKEHVKKHVPDTEQPEALEAIIKEIDHYSKHYVRIALPKQETDQELRACLDSIHDLSVEVTFPFLLGAYEKYTQARLKKKEVIEICRLIESYVFRRAICGIPTHGLNRIFVDLTGQIDREQIDTDDYVQSLKVVFARMTGGRHFPSDREFKDEFLTKDVYNSRICNYLLHRLENYEHKEPIRIDEKYTIEHVMPQTLSEEWQEELGDDWIETHEKYLHTIGNLTLTGYNSELSNHSFKEKRDLPGGYSDSRLRLSRSLAQAEQWNKSAIEKRAEILLEKACKVWPHHGIPQQMPSIQNWTLADHHHLTGEMMVLFQQLWERIQRLDASVREQINQDYMTYRTNRIFVSIIPQARRLLLTLNLRFPDIDDPQETCRDMTNIGHFGVGDVEVGISSADELDYIVFLIKQAFDRQMEDRS